MQVVNISIENITELLNSLKNGTLLSKLAPSNIRETQSFIRHAGGDFFVLTEFIKKEDIVHFGELANQTLQKNPLLQYATVPLGIILAGEVVVLEDGKGVKRLLPGDFIGLFETAYYLHSGVKRKIGNWSLVADTDTKILFFGDISSLPLQKKEDDFQKHFQTFLIDLARADIVPKPITDLPLLDWVASKVTSTLLENCIILTHTHILPSNFAFFRHLAHLVGYHNIFILEKPYSTIRPIFNKLIHMGAEVVPVIMAEHTPHEFTLKRSLDVLWEKVLNARKLRHVGRMIIIDDGADLLLSIPWGKLTSIEIVGVEQTRRGIERIMHTTQKLPAIVNVASSGVKKNIESLFISKAMVNKMKNLGLFDLSPRIGIIGIGSIGTAMSREFRKNDLEIIDYDVVRHIQKTEGKDQSTSIDTVMNKSDVVIGCTGTDFLKGVALERVEGRKTLISASSADIEFFSMLNLASFSSDPFGTINVKVHPRLELSILNGGYPINFDREREWEPSEDIQVTRCLLYVGLIQSLVLVDARYRGKLVKLDERSQEEIVKKWLELKRGKRDPSEELQDRSPALLSVSDGEAVNISVWPS